MTSNSIRIQAELFELARTTGTLMSRSTAQQIEHWARMGAALESCGLTVEQAASLLKTQSTAENKGDAELWKYKRQRQKADLESIRAGRLSQDQLNWFSGGKARRLKIVGLPY